MRFSTIFAVLPIAGVLATPLQPRATICPASHDLVCCGNVAPENTTNAVLKVLETVDNLLPGLGIDLADLLTDNDGGLGLSCTFASENQYCDVGLRLACCTGGLSLPSVSNITSALESGSSGDITSDVTSLLGGLLDGLLADNDSGDNDNTVKSLLNGLLGTVSTLLTSAVTDLANAFGADIDLSDITYGECLNIGN